MIMFNKKLLITTFISILLSISFILLENNSYKNTEVQTTINNKHYNFLFDKEIQSQSYKIKSKGWHSISSNLKKSLETNHH